LLFDDCKDKDIEYLQEACKDFSFYTINKHNY
jgi:hypothetical protein